MQEPAVALEEVADHTHLDELPNQQKKGPAEEPAEKGLHEAHGDHGAKEDLVEKVHLRGEVVG